MNRPTSFERVNGSNSCSETVSSLSGHALGHQRDGGPTSPRAVGATRAEPDEYPEVRPSTIDGGLRGTCRASISPPKVPLGQPPESEADARVQATALQASPAEIPIDETHERGQSASETNLNRTDRSTANDSTGVRSNRLECGEGDSSDIIVSEGRCARMAMLDLRLPPRFGRYADGSRRTSPRSQARVAASVAVPAEPVIRIAASGQTDGMSSSAAASEHRPMPELPPRGDIARLAGTKGGLPKRIGSGSLVPAKLTWMPKDPFGNGVREKSAPRFRWELMLTSACVTAVCTLGIIWLLRAVAA